MMKFFDESILIRLRHSLKQLKFSISSIFCLYSFNFEITYNAAKIKQICNWRVVVSGLLFFVQLFIKSFDYTVILITEICLVNYFYISTFCHFVWCCEAWVPPLGLLFNGFSSFCDDRNGLGMTSITWNS